jgi:DinB superfamily
MTGLKKNLTLLLPALLLGALSATAADPAPDARQIFDRQLGNTEREVVGLVEAMPADKFDFAPSNGNFNGVRTFALQARHIAFEINAVASALLGETIPGQEHDNGPDNLKTKDQIVKYLKDAFAHAHRAVATLNNSNLLELTADPFNPKGRSTRIASVAIFYWHTYDHYGQMVEYLRMNGIVPPASRR